jgi:glucose/arabinose dehydrogenase
LIAQLYIVPDADGSDTRQFVCATPNEFDEKNPDKVASYEKLAEVKFGRIREVAQGPDGYIYFSTSNRDGRGKPANSDDRIFRIMPK